MSIRLSGFYIVLNKSLNSAYQYLHYNSDPRPQAFSSCVRQLQRMKETGKAAILWLLLMTSVTSAQSTLLNEDFQTYAPGSTLVGQGGWIEGMPVGSSILTISNGNYLPTQVLNGRAATGLGQDNIAVHPFSFDPTTLTTLQYQAYATSDTPRTHNTTLAFEKYVPGGAPFQNPIYWSPDGFNAGGPKRWQFSVLSNTFSVVGGFDQIVTMRIVINGVTNEAYGMYDFGSGFVETPHFAVSQAELDSINGVVLDVDHRTPGIYTGMEVDNLLLTSVSAVPEPSTILLTGASALGFGIYLWQRKHRQARLANAWATDKRDRDS